VESGHPTTGASVTSTGRLMLAVLGGLADVERRADLGGADLSRAHLNDANLNCTRLSGANLSGARLSRAILNNANLTVANLTGADLSGTSLYGAQYLTQEQLDKACGTDVKVSTSSVHR